VVLGYTALARLQQARGNFREALLTLDGLAEVAEQRLFPSHLVAQVAAIRAQFELARGNLAAAVSWADASALSAGDNDLSYPRENVNLALARVRIAQAREAPASPFLQDVLRLLDRLLEDAEAKARLGSVLEILIVRALALRHKVTGRAPGLHWSVRSCSPPHRAISVSSSMRAHQCWSCCVMPMHAAEYQAILRPS